MEYYADWDEEGENELYMAQKAKLVDTFEDKYQCFVIESPNEEKVSFQDRALKRAKRTSKTEIERYLAGPTCDDVSILEWWRLNAKTFPALSRMARDFMAIQVSG